MRKRIPVFHLGRLFPNMVTLTGLCCGLSAMRFAMDKKWEIAVALLVASAILDGLDGRIARLLNSASTFGAHLDSLSDFVCFGVSPVFLLYVWQLHTLRGAGWAVVLFFSVCCALRLARFNTHLGEERPYPWQKQFFTGIPSPAGGMLALCPLIATFIWPISSGVLQLICAVWAVLVGSLMASRIPTFALRKMMIRHEWVLPIMVVCGGAAALVVIEPWPTFLAAGLLYVASIPFSVLRHRRLIAETYNDPTT